VMGVEVELVVVRACVVEVIDIVVMACACAAWISKDGREGCDMGAT
jgi:hypothetical protein